MGIYPVFRPVPAHPSYFSISHIPYFRACEISFPDVSLSVRVHTILGALHICLTSYQISLSAPGSHITDAYGFHLLERIYALQQDSSAKSGTPFQRERCFRISPSPIPDPFSDKSYPPAAFPLPR